MSVEAAFDTDLPHAEISIERTFDAGHRIVGHEGKCANLHGHTYSVHLMARGLVREPGFVVDFGHVKNLIDEWDHKMLLWNQDPLETWFRDVGCVVTPDAEDLKAGIIRLPFNPTAENMARYLAEEAWKRFNLHAIMVELKETPTTMARYVI